jgi:MarR family transcriptional repressor of emrRAB
MRREKAKSVTGQSRERERTGNMLGAAALAISGSVDQSNTERGRRGQVANAALSVLLQWPPRTIGDLSKILRRSHSATVRLVEELQAEGLVTKHSGADRRSIVLTLTPAGRREAAGILATREKVLGDVVARLTPTDRQGLSRILEKILIALTSDREACDHICRLCNLAACPQKRCPAELTALEHYAGGQ